MARLPCLATVTSAAHVEDFTRARPGVERRGERFRAQRARKRGNFRDGFPLPRQSSQEVRFGFDGNLFVNELPYGEHHLFVGQRTAESKLFRQRFEHGPSIGWRR